MSQDRELFNDRMLEGEYTTWRNLWGYDLDTLYGLTDTQMYVDNEGTVYASRAGAVEDTAIINRAGTIQIIANWCVYTDDYEKASSILNKYVIMVDAPLTWAKFRVYRRGVLRFQFSLLTLNPAIDAIAGVAMSPDGRYIAVAAEAGPIWGLIYLFEGS